MNLFKITTMHYKMRILNNMLIKLPNLYTQIYMINKNKIFYKPIFIANPKS